MKINKNLYTFSEQVGRRGKDYEMSKQLNLILECTRTFFPRNKMTGA
jgi:hypothetical protein